MSFPRVISGKARGMRLRPVPGDSTRPITDRVKEALFNILGTDIRGASLLDLFAGTGSVGIEALSRGADLVRFIDNNRLAIETIHYNLQHTHLDSKAEIFRTDAFMVLKQIADKQFDYIYVAPPQYKEMWQRVIEELDKNPTWIKSDSWIIVQIDPIEYKPLTPQSFKEFEQRRYGSTMLVFYESNGSKFLELN